MTLQSDQSRVSVPQRAPSAIGKTVAVLEALAEEHRLSEIARVTGLHTSTVHRILQELVGLDWAREDEDRGYALGARLLALAGRASDDSDIARSARPALRMRSRLGLSLPLHCTAIGKSILATLPDEEVRLIASRTGLPRRTPHTITAAEPLLTNLAAARARGWALDDEENELHTRCLASVVMDHRGVPIGGISLSALVFDMDRERARRLAPLVIHTAREVSAALGARP